MNKLFKILVNMCGFCKVPANSDTSTFLTDQPTGSIKSGKVNLNSGLWGLPLSGGTMAVSPNHSVYTAIGPSYTGVPVYPIIHHKGKIREVFSIYSNSGNPVVTLYIDGTVNWANDVNVDEAAQAFSKTLCLAAEIASGVTQTMRQNVRDKVFEEIITFANEKGSFTAEELHCMWESMKVMDRLRGIS